MSDKDRGDIFELLVEADRLIDWYIANKPGWEGPVTLPRRWRSREVAPMVPKFARELNGTWYYRNYPLRVQGTTEGQ